MIEFEASIPMYCILCGKRINQGEPCHVILTGRVTDKEDFDDRNSLGLACSCLLRAAKAQKAKTHEPIAED